MNLKLLAALCLGMVFTASALEENFSKVDASGFVPGWETQSIDWAVGQNALLYRGGQEHSLALPTALAAGAEVTAEVGVQIEKRVSATGWALAALTIRLNEKNYWHLALCEAPPEQNHRHFFELSESLDGHWLAHAAPETRLTPTPGHAGTWDFGRVYRLRLTLNASGIAGTVTDDTGKICAQLGYKFDRRAVTAGAPALAAAGLAARFTAFSATTAQLLPAASQTAPVFPRYDAAGSDVARGDATGFFHAEKSRGRWWLIDPNGHGFYWVGADHASYHGHWCEKLGYAPYGRVAQQKYGSETNWAAETLRRMQAWGFNTLAAGNSPALRHQGLPHIEFLSLGSSFAGRDDICPLTTWTGFPNVFSPDWARHCDLVARRACAPNAKDPWLLGYFFDNELEWLGKTWKPDGLFPEVWKKPADHTGKQAWIALLQKETTIAKFNAEFGTTFADFAALAADVKPRPAHGELGEALAQTWARLVAEKYFSVCAAAIRRHDPNHMLFGCRFAGSAPDVWDIAGKYCDVVTVNIYPFIDVERGVPEKEFTKVRDWQQKVTEWSFPALDAGLPSRHGAGMRVDTQEQRAKCFAHYQDFLFRLPYVVGSSYFMWLDEPALGISSTFPEDSNYGLINGNDEPYPLITAAAAKLNAEVYQRHHAGGFEPVHLAEPVIPKTWSWKLKDAAAVPAQLKLTAGRLTLEGPRGGHAWQLALEGKPIANLFPVVHQQSDEQNQWTHPQAARITGIRANALMTAVEMEFIFGGAQTARAVMRYWIPKNGEWFASEGVSVMNTSAQPWRLGALFHYCAPVVTGDPAKIEPLCDAPEYYQALAGWADHTQNRAVGCWAPRGGKLTGFFWKDAPTAFHSDMREPADVLLQPGATWQASPEPLLWFAVPDASQASSAVAARRAAEQAGLQ
ncbi:MAG: hypothetical protein NTY53_12275 [Kiritimatiellaeota bacterium]|nr:hypothetical protein [Kiritimatiellota bacterium]